MIKIKVNLTELHEVRRRIAAFEDNMTAAMRKIQGVFMSAVARAFSGESNPVSGEGWATLSPITAARRAKYGHNGKILQVSGNLATVSGEHDHNSASVSSNEAYSTTQHFGAKQGSFGRTSRNGPIPWGDIPARPFMPIDAEGNISEIDEQEIIDTLTEALESISNR